MTVVTVGVICTCLLFLWNANPVHGVLTLVVVGLLFSAGLLCCGLEFTALIVLLVYVGAVTVLFVFVVMMVNLRATPVGYITAEALPVWVTTVGAMAWVTTTAVPAVVVSPQLTQLLNLYTVGYVLYATPMVITVVVTGLILFVAMVSAICLSLVAGENYRTQEFYSQIRKSNAVFVLQHD